MATYSSTQVANSDARPIVKNPVSDVGGRLRVQYFDFTVTTELAIDDEVNIVRLPSGRKRIFPALCVLTPSTHGSSRTANVGFRAYTDPDATPSAVSEDPDGLATLLGTNVSTDVAFDVAGTVLINSEEEVDLFIQVKGGTVAVNETYSGYIVYSLD